MPATMLLFSEQLQEMMIKKKKVAGDEIAVIATPVMDSDSWRRGKKT